MTYVALVMFIFANGSVSMPPVYRFDSYAACEAYTKDRRRNPGRERIILIHTRCLPANQILDAHREGGPAAAQ